MSKYNFKRKIIPKSKQKIGLLFVLIILTLINLNLLNINQNKTDSNNYFKPNSSSILLDDKTLAWYTTWGGDQTDYALSMDIDEENNIYLAGYTRSYGAGDEDLLLLKYNDSGDLQWNVTWGDNNRDLSGKVAVDSQGYAYLIGLKKSGVYDNDMWLIKYNSSGQLEWNKQLWPATASFYYIPSDIAIDSDDNIYITGHRYNISGDMNDLILFKYDSSGGLIWDRIWGENNTMNEVGRGIAIDKSDNIYLVTTNSSNFVAFRNNIILLKYNKSGGYQWSKVWDKGYSNIGWDITLDSFNNIYITGYRDLTGSGNKDLLLLKYNNNGDFQWNRTWDGSDVDYGRSIICDSMDNIFITGYTQLLGGDNDILIAKYDSQGNKLWIKVWGPGVIDSGFTIAINSLGNVLIGGTHVATNNNDVILLKIGKLGNFSLTSDADNPNPNGSFILSWNASDYAHNYSVYVHNRFITEINGSVMLLVSGITGLTHSISNLTNGDYYYLVVAFNDIANRSSNCIYVDVKIAPQIIFYPNLEYLNTTEPMETDLYLEINCSVINSTVLEGVYLNENSTGVYVNRSMNLGINNEWTYKLDISELHRGDVLSFLFYAKDSFYVRKNDNNNLNFSLFIGDIYPPSATINYNLIYNPNYISEATLFNILAFDVGERPSGIFQISYKIDSGTWKIYIDLFTLNNSIEGLHTIYFNATDAAGNSIIENVTIYLVTANSDVDNDGLIYSDELIHSTNPFNNDTDGDKLSDGDEVNIYHTNPLSPDTDGDRLSDYDEVNKYYTNPLSQDTDGDGFSDYDEIFTFKTDPNSILSSPPMNFALILLIISAMIVFFLIGLFKIKSTRRRRIEKFVIKQIMDPEKKILDCNKFKSKLRVLGSKLDIKEIIEDHQTSGRYILDGQVFIKETELDEIKNEILEKVHNIYKKNLSMEDKSKLTRINIKNLE